MGPCKWLHLQLPFKLQRRRGLRSISPMMRPIAPKKRKLDDQERRLDGDGMAYTLSEFVAQYGGSVENPPLQWTTERRLDHDGQAYTLDDFINEYGGTHAAPPNQWKEGRQWKMPVNFADL